MSESEIITELEYARGIHEGYLTGDPGPWDGGRQDHINIIKAKNLVIRTIQTKTNKKKAIIILKEWIGVHQFWIHRVRKFPDKAKQSGGVKWHKRWIKTYKNTINIIT